MQTESEPGSGPERDPQEAREGQPRLPRRGVLALTVLGAVTLVTALVGSASSWGQADVPRPGVSGGLGIGVGGPPGAPAPYGVTGCERPADASSVDVAVAARALGPSGGTAATLGGAEGGLQVGASVRDLAGYAAQGVPPCGVVQVTVYLHDSASGSVPGSLQQASRPLEVAGAGGRGGVVAVDWRTWEASLPEGARSGDLQEQASWLVTLVDPVPGAYRLTGRVSAVGGAGEAGGSGQPSSGDVEVLLDITPHAG